MWCSHSFGNWGSAEPCKNELWSCYRPVPKPQPLATLTSSSKAEMLYLLTLLVMRATPHHRDKLQRLHEGWWSRKKYSYTSLMTQTNYPTSELQYPSLWNCSSPAISCRLINQELEVFSQFSECSKHTLGNPQPTVMSHFSLWTKHYNFIFA